MQHQAVSLARICSSSLSVSVSLSRATLQSKHNLPLLALHTLLAANGKGNWLRQPPHTLPSLPHSPTCLPSLFPSHSLSFSGPSSRRQRHPLSLLPNYRAFHFNFDVACGKHVAWAYVCVCRCVCVVHTNPEHEMALTGNCRQQPPLYFFSVSLSLSAQN